MPCRATILFMLFLTATAASAASGLYELHFNSHPYPGQWYLPAGFSHDPSGGESGSGALRFTKTANAPYVIASHQITIAPGAKYRLSIMVRCDKQVRVSGKGLFAVEYKKNGKHVSGNYFSLPKNQTLSEDSWEELVLDVTPPSAYDTAAISFYMGRALFGTVWYDNVRLEKVGAVPADIFDLPPSNLTIRGTTADLTFRALVYQPIPQEAIAMTLTSGDRQTTAKADANGYYRFQLSALPEGELTTRVVLRQLTDGQVLGEATFRYFVKHAPMPERATWVDDDGYTLADGKPFLPIGFYCRDLSEELLARVSAAGANCIMSYTIGREKDIAQKLDLARRHNLGVLFNVMYQHEQSKSKISEFAGAQGVDAVLRAWVTRFRGHPALLGWYLSDENPRDELPRVRQLREMINELDPNHFTVTLTYRPIDFPAFISTGDVLATDPYPIETAASQTISKVRQLIGGAAALTPRVWMVPQAFNWGAYRQHDNPDQPYRFPSELEIRAMTLAGAIHGAKGFLFYAYHSIFERGENRYPGSAEENWLRVVPTIALLQELSPFLLSRETPPSVVVEGNNTYARAWLSDGKLKVLIAGEGPGENEATIVIPRSAPLRSRYGCTSYLGNNIYRFRAPNISCDILE